jgi:hypothetical protein
MLVEQFADARQAKNGPVIVQAGRRVDAPNAETPRFPVANVKLVRTRIKAALSSSKPSALITSAACGTDLLALEIAGEMKIDRFILLPSQPAFFRESSVTDRPGDWGPIFDQVIRTSQVDVLTVPEGQQGYLQTNIKLISRALALANQRGTQASALVVWNKQSRGTDDVTEHFLAQARQQHLPVTEISTL